MESVLRFKVNSIGSNVVIGVALVPAIAALAAAFGLVQRGEILLGALAGAAFLAILMPAGFWARKLGSNIEVDADALRQIDRRGRVTRITWSEPHELFHRTTIVRRMGIPVLEHTKVRVVAGDRKINFSCSRSLRFPDVPEIAEARAGVERAIAASSAAQLRRARACLANGESVSFGALSLEPTGLRVHQQVVPFGQARLDARNKINGRREWVLFVAARAEHTHDENEVPNARVLAELLRSPL